MSKKYTPAPKKRSTVLRIVVLVLAVALVVGIIILPLQGIALEADAADESSVTVSSFEKGKLSDALREAADGTDYNYITKAAVSGGTLNAQDYTALQSIPNLEYIELAGAMTEGGIVPENALPSRNQLTYISLPLNTEEIGTRAFSNNKKLVKVLMPVTVKKIGDGAFEFCESLESFPSSEAITYIGEGAFNSCKAFTSFYIPSQITEIYANTFSKCGFSEISIPATVTKIGDSAFADCSSLKDIYVYGADTQISGSGTFQNVSATVHVLAENADNYGAWEGNNISTSDDLVQTEAPVVSEPAADSVYATEQPAETEAAETEAATEAAAAAEETEATPAAAPANAEKTASLSIVWVIIIVVIAVAAAVGATVLVMKKKSK